MRYRTLGLAITALLLGSATSAGEAAHFGYDGEHGPAHWGELDPSFGLCKTGVNQSPIDVAKPYDANLPTLEASYPTAATGFVNNGHTVQANFAPGGTLARGDERFELKQLHFHSPSEHRLDGKDYPAEIHLVHMDAAGHLAVVGILVEEGPANPAIAKLWATLPDEPGETLAPDAGLRANDLMPADRSYRYYNGSLTTPPCTEGVRWIVLETPITMSAEQIASLRGAIGFANNRPTQPVNARAVLE